MNQFFIQNSDIIIKLVLAMTLGVFIGIERYIAHKTAGMRTYALLSMGSALFVIISEVVTQTYPNHPLVSFAPLGVLAAVITGIGFLGAGAMFHKDDILVGLTTATGLWVSAGIGMAVGFGYYLLAITATLASIVIFSLLLKLENGIRRHFGITGD